MNSKNLSGHPSHICETNIRMANEVVDKQLKVDGNFLKPLSIVDFF